MKKVIAKLRLRTRRDDGASAVEYGLLVALIAVVIAATVALLGTSLNTKFNDINACVGSNDCDGAGGGGGAGGGLRPTIVVVRPATTAGARSP